MTRIRATRCCGVLLPGLLLAMLAAGASHAADDLGRVFLTPAQRQSLDAQRDSGLATDGVPGTAETQTGTAPDRNVLLNGVVRRSHGPDVVWVNGARAGAGSGNPVQVRRGPDQRNRVSVQDADGTVARLQPGQFLDPSTGRVADCLGCTLLSTADLSRLNAPLTPLPGDAPGSGQGKPAAGL